MPVSLGYDALRCRCFVLLAGSYQPNSRLHQTDARACSAAAFEFSSSAMREPSCRCQISDCSPLWTRLSSARRRDMRSFNSFWLNHCCRFGPFYLTGVGEPFQLPVRHAEHGTELFERELFVLLHQPYPALDRLVEADGILGPQCVHDMRLDRPAGQALRCSALAPHLRPQPAEKLRTQGGKIASRSGVNIRRRLT